MLVKFVRSDPPYLPGEIAGFEEEAAERLIRRGVAERHVVAAEAGAGAAEPREPPAEQPAPPVMPEPPPAPPAEPDADSDAEAEAPAAPADEPDQPAADPPTTTRRARR